ncbi:MAG: 3,4-dihydroxy-2-butanone-4-phosphate synthase [Thermoplasmata archaeon]|nr:3,4-dihydroxy-2-butanone-4-phosphate synthase [Euryarchaeota archaeon]RLF64744.1 MAG: 3,4-dihydroxy-2-butanone-4-phosphate synthase [Thermoplasmata archaeon]
MGIDLKDIKSDLLAGRPILVYDFDDREGETDIVFYAPKVTYYSVYFMRIFGGGLICVALGPDVWKKLGLPYLSDIFKDLKEYETIYKSSMLKIPYDEKSSFSITVNHVDTFTGISDKDRALTISELGRLAEIAKHSNEKELKELFAKSFRSPGHVHILNARERLLDERKGHTELVVSLAELTGLAPAMAIVEMLGDDGLSLSKKKAIRFAEEHRLHFIEGTEIVEVWECAKES